MFILEIFCNFAMDFTFTYTFCFLRITFVNGAQSTEWSSKTADGAQNQLLKFKSD